MSKREKHPYGEYIPARPRLMLIGSFPIAKFTDPKRKHEIKEHEFDFFFGGEKNLLWKLLGEVFNRPVKTLNQIIRLLESEGIALGDVIKSCRRSEGSSSDSALYDIEWNAKLLTIIRLHNIKQVYFTSKKVESWFNKLFPATADLRKETLISPSGQSVRSLSQLEDYLEWKKSNKSEKSFKYILTIYKQKFVTRS
ncbi:MAG: hypothetical protein NDI69_14960 [Bacteriovoracaceae bacterium]|nr:hypothetical protein [Bacteriovoracaceae bacterium]